MIRRDLPRSSAGQQAGAASHWLLISQVEHARLSHQLAAAWVDPLPGATADSHQEWLAAVLHHDDGWDDWRSAPRIDPEHGRPYGFTEMPPPLAQEIWSDSVDACRALGPLAGWVVASHFIGLQGKPDDDPADCDLSEWARWLGEQDRRRTDWLAEWRSADPERHTQAVADRCLYLLQQLDWLSLWLCCRAPVAPGDTVEPLELGTTEAGLGPFRFQPAEKPDATGRWTLRVAPWPFAGPAVYLVAPALLVPTGRYGSPDELRGEVTAARWRLVPG